MTFKLNVSNFEISNDNKFFLIAGPCAIESRNHAIYHAKKIKQICKDLNINYVFKSSFDKANRTDINSKRGIGIEEGLKILDEIKKTLNVRRLTLVLVKDL